MNTHSDFARRHIGPQGEERREMLDSLGYQTLDELIADIVPADIRMQDPLDLPAAKSETEALEELRSILRKNKLLKTFIGQGYYGTITPLRHPAQRTGKSRLVYGLHALSAGNRPGTPGNAHELPDHGLLPDGPAGGERLPAG